MVNHLGEVILTNLCDTLPISLPLKRVFLTQVYVYAQTVVIDESINVHFSLLVYTRQLIIDRSYALTIDVSGQPGSQYCDYSSSVQS